MDKMIVRVPVVIKAKVTEDLKAKIIADMKRQVQAAELDFEQFQFNAKRALNEQAGAGPEAARALQEQIEYEKAQRGHALQELKDKLERAENLEIGSEVGHGTLERSVEITVGSDLEALMGAEIVVEDGEFRIMPQTDHPERYAKMKKITLDNGREFTVVSLRQHKNVYLMKVGGIDTMDDAETLRGRTIVLRPDELPPLPEGQFYVRDIIGFAVVTPEGEPVGTLKDVISPGSTDVFVIAPPQGEEILVAAIGENIRKIDWETKQIVVVLPEWI